MRARRHSATLAITCRDAAQPPFVTLGEALRGTSRQPDFFRLTSAHGLSVARCCSPEEGIDGSRLTQSVITAEQVMGFSSNGPSELLQLELIGVGLRHGHAEWLASLAGPP